MEEINSFLNKTHFAMTAIVFVLNSELNEKNLSVLKLFIYFLYMLLRIRIVRSQNEVNDMDAKNHIYQLADQKLCVVGTSKRYSLLYSSLIFQSLGKSTRTIKKKRHIFFEKKT